MESVNGISKNNHQLCLMNIWAMFLPGGGRVRLHQLLHFIKINSSNLQVSTFNKNKLFILERGADVNVFEKHVCL